MPSITVHIAPSGNALSDGGSSLTGHMWFTLNDGNGNESSYGFAPKNEGEPHGDGEVKRNDDSHYVDPPYNYEKEISQEQYDAIQNYAERAAASADGNNGRWAEYNGLYNSCVDFTYSALNAGGIIDAPEGGFQGNIFPWFNRWDMERSLLGENWWDRNIARPLADLWDRAKNWVWPRDPIILDLDGNGLETVGLASNVYFDHDGDGVLTKTGWAGKNDGLLVWDRNANGTIDTGAELFGDFTVLPNGTLAPNGFAALAALDSNGDGILDASDPAFAELKLWRDTSQDGQTGAGELISLADAGIVSLNLANTLKNQSLGNGNQLTREGSFTRADGTTAAMGEFRLASSTFDTKFAEAIEVPESLKTLPTMGGSGNVRELQQAAAQSSSVAGLLAQFQGATTRAEQKALLDQLLTSWADTSGMAKSLEERAAGKYRIQYEAFGVDRRSSNIDTVAFAAISSGNAGGSGGGAALMSDAGGMYLSERYRNLIAEWSRKLHVLEAFNGQYFFNLPTQKSQTDGANWGLAISAGSGSSSGAGAIAIEAFPTLRVSFSQAQLDLLQQANDSLKESVYASLVMQTRLKPYLDQIELVIDEQGIRLDATSLNQMLTEQQALNPERYLADLLDLDKYTDRFLVGANWNGLADMRKSWRWRGGDGCVNDEAWRVAA